MEIIARLEASRERTLKHFLLGEHDLARTYGPGKWPVKFILHHLADAETVLYDRIRRTIAETRPVLWAFDADVWANGLSYGDVPLELSRQLYDSVRSAVIHLARVHYHKNGNREFVHSQTGVRTLQMEFDKVATHNENHLAQIEKALARRYDN